MQSGSGTHLSDLYLRYDCDAYILYILVLTVDPDGEGSSPRLELDTTDLEDYYFKVHVPKLGVAPWLHFQWVVEGARTVGYEAAIHLTPSPPGDYAVEGHAQVIDQDDESQTSGTGEIPLKIICNVIAIELASFAAQPVAGGVRLEWETGTELDNDGFNLYRATSESGPFARINEALIPAQGDAVAGASYTYADSPGYGTFYYKLEDVDLSGLATLHGPVSVVVSSPFRLPLHRPVIPR
jgi:hypothetical protein